LSTIEFLAITSQELERIFMKSLKQIHGAVSCGVVLCSLLLSAQGAPLSAGDPVLLEKTQGKFDFIRIDSSKRRLLLAHTGNKSLDVVDLDSHKVLKIVPTGAAQDVAVDTKNGKYYVSVSNPPRMVIVDSTKLEVPGEVSLPSPADLITFNSENGRAYVCNDEAPELWVIDPKEKKIVNTVTLSGKGMEDLTFDTHNKLLFQAVKDANTVVVIDSSNNKILNNWTCVPAASPHGIALVPGADSLLVAGGGGKLVLMKGADGKVLSSADIAPKVDEMAYDIGSHLAYCASGQGKISVVKVDGNKLTSLDEVPSTAGARSIVVDQKTHTVWIAYAKGEQSFAQPFVVSK
jgi:DNA-binding beta-propeller fold protein YncE